MSKSLRLRLFSVCLAMMFGILTSCSNTIASNDSNTNENVSAGSISGKAFYTNKESHSGILITLISTDGLVSADLLAQESVRSLTGYRAAVGTTASETTKEDGSYSFTNVTPGTYTIYASAENSSQKAVQTNIVVQSNQSVTASDLKLTATSAVSGKITLDEKDSGNGGFIVFISSTSFMAITGDDGSFTISGVPVAGDYTIAVMKGNFYTVWETQVSVTSETANLGTKNFTSSEIAAASGTSEPLYGKIKFFEEPYNSAAGYSTEERLVTTGEATLTWGENMATIDGEALRVAEIKKMTRKDSETGEVLFTGTAFRSQTGTCDESPWALDGEIMVTLSFPVTAVKDIALTNLQTGLYFAKTDRYKAILRFNGEDVAYMGQPDTTKILTGTFGIDKVLKAGEKANLEIVLYAVGRRTTSNLTDFYHSFALGSFTLSVVSENIYTPQEIYPKTIEISTEKTNGYEIDSITGGKSLQFYADVLPMTVSNKECVWSIVNETNSYDYSGKGSHDNSGSYTFATIDENGLLTTKKIPESQQITVRCTSVDTPYVYAEKTVYYYPDTTEYSFGGSDLPEGISATSGCTLTNNGYLKMEKDSTISFDVSGKCSISAYGYTVDENGYNNGYCSIKIKAGTQEEGLLNCSDSKYYYVYSEEASTVTITAPWKIRLNHINIKYDDSIEYVPITSVNRDYSKSHLIYPGNIESLRDKITVYPTNATYADCQTIDWSISEGSEYATIDQYGHLTGKDVTVIGDKRINVGFSYIHYYYTYDEKEKVLKSVQRDGSLEMYFYGREPEITITAAENASLPINAGETIQLTAAIGPSDAINIADYSSESITWQSSAKSVATVDSNGMVTGCSAGDVNIYASVPFERYHEHYESYGDNGYSFSSGFSTEKASTSYSLYVSGE